MDKIPVLHRAAQVLAVPGLDDLVQLLRSINKAIKARDRVFLRIRVQRGLVTACVRAHSSVPSARTHRCAVVRQSCVMVLGTAVVVGEHAVELRLRDIDRTDDIGRKRLVDLLAPQLAVHVYAARCITVEDVHAILVAVKKRQENLQARLCQNLSHVGLDVADERIVRDLAAYVLPEVLFQLLNDRVPRSLPGNMLIDNLKEFRVRGALGEGIHHALARVGIHVVADRYVLARIERGGVGRLLVARVFLYGALGCLKERIAVIVDSLIQAGVRILARVLAGLQVLLERDGRADLRCSLTVLRAPRELAWVLLSRGLELVGHLIVAAQVGEVQLQAVRVAGKDHERMPAGDGRVLRIKHRHEREVAHDRVRRRGGGAGTRRLGIGGGDRRKRHAGRKHRSG